MKQFITFFLFGWCLGLALMLTAQMAHCSEITDIITIEAQKQGLEPEIAIAVATLESGLNPRAIGSKNEVGLFQIRPEFSHIKRISLFDPKINAREGIKLLIYYRKTCPTKEGLLWIQCFNQGLRHPRFPRLLPYYKKFSSIYAEL